MERLRNLALLLQTCVVQYMCHWKNMRSGVSNGVEDGSLHQIDLVVETLMNTESLVKSPQWYSTC